VSRAVWAGHIKGIHSSVYENLTSSMQAELRSSSRALMIFLMTILILMVKSMIIRQDIAEGCRI